MATPAARRCTAAPPARSQSGVATAVLLIRVWQDIQKGYFECVTATQRCALHCLHGLRQVPCDSFC